jgi:hypothetical protein
VEKENNIKGKGLPLYFLLLLLLFYVDLSHDYKELATSIQGLAQLETTFQPHLDTFAQATLVYAGNMTTMASFDADWLSEIHDYMSYHNSMKVNVTLSWLGWITCV